MSIITDEDWYMNNKALKQNIIVHLMYGLTRCGMNGWLLEQERKWMQDNRLQYCQDNVVICKTKLRGFVYSIMNCQFSNSTIKLFHNVMRRKFGEYITVRKPSKMLSSNISYTQRNFLGGNGYIVTFDDHDSLTCKSDFDKVETLGLKWIELCKSENVTLLEVHDMVDEMCHDMDSGLNNTDIGAMRTTLEENNVRNYVTPSKSVRKQPRINVIELNKTSTDTQAGKLYYCVYEYLSVCIKYLIL